MPLNSQYVANFISDGLNKHGATEKITFRVMAEIDRDRDAPYANVKGVLRSLSGDVLPVPSPAGKTAYRFSLEFPVNAPMANKYVLQVKRVIESFIAETEGREYPFGDGKGVVSYVLGETGEYKTMYAIGQAVPVRLTVNVVYTEDMTTSGAKHWLLDGTEIPFLRESVSIEREGQLRDVFTEDYKSLLLTSQTKYYTFRVPYESAFFKALQTGILAASLAQGSESDVHTLTYYDGAAFGEFAPFTASVRLFRSGMSSSERPNESWFDITFADYSVPSAVYQLGLLDFPFDMNGDDTRFFASQSAQQEYFEGKVASGGTPFVNIEAPSMDSLYITKQVYQGDRSAPLNQFDYVNKNYAVIKVTARGKSPKYFYYFIEKATIGAAGKMLLDLRMDTVQTYFFDPDITIPACLIERAHLNRFEDDPTQEGYVRFNRSDTRLFNAEQGFDTPKRLVSRTKLDINFTGNSAVDNWLNENVAYWVYVFIDPTYGEYNSYRFGDGTNAHLGGGNAKNLLPLGFDGAASVFCYPIYSNGYDGEENLTQKNIIEVVVPVTTDGNTVSKTVILVPNSSARSAVFVTTNGSVDNAYTYTMKISLIPPFSGAGNMSIDSNNNLIISAGNTSSTSSYATIDVSGNGSDWNIKVANESPTEIDGVHDAVFWGNSQEKKSVETDYYGISENSLFLKTYVTRQQAPQLSFNPKLNGQNFRELVITSANGDEFSYDIQKLQESRISFLYSEPIQPEITKYYMRVNAPAGLYLEGTEENYTGLVGSTDNALAFTNDQYAAFIANNKNFYLQSNMKIALGAVRSTAGAISQGVRGNPAGAVGTLAGTGLSIAETLIDRSFTVDNMRSAPDQMKNANGNVLFNLFATDLGLYVEKYVALDSGLQAANDFMDLYGFSVGVVDDIGNYTNIRKYHNYVKAQVNSVVGNISNEARNDLRRRFSEGVRFWTSDTISYEYENYENWMEE